MVVTTKKRSWKEVDLESKVSPYPDIPYLMWCIIQVGERVHEPGWEDVGIGMAVKPLSKD